ncbi:MAG: TonB-dependent receptor, partial [Alphaproteobacteria bacterium]|nr:TonB-dependent receptor [Alphaproteobacteria bacterium]
GKGGAGGLQTSGLSPGMRFPHVPRNLASLWSTYEFQDATLKGLKVGAGYTYHGSQPIYYPNALLPGVEPLLPSWGTVDLMSAYSFTFNGARFTAQLNVNNLFDRTYYTDAVVYQRLTRGTQLNSARTYGAPFSVLGSLRAEF